MVSNSQAALDKANEMVKHYSELLPENYFKNQRESAAKTITNFGR